MFSDNSENNHFLAIKLEKELDLSDFVNLENLLVRDQKITELKVSNCPKLTYLSCANNELGSLNLNNLVNLGIINCSNNLLTELDLSSQNPKKVTSLRLDNNNFSHSDLSIFSRFTRVRDLYLGTNKKKRIDKNIYNRFFGSLEELKNFTNLVELDINATDIDSGLEYLPTENLSTFYCANQRERAGVEKIKRVLGLSDKLAGGESNRGQREKIARIKSFQDYFRAAKKFHQLLLWRERAIPQESLELADTELKLA
ncbi:9784_t:CDS:2, partial [Funneliformis geosporum]